MQHQRNHLFFRIFTIITALIFMIKPAFSAENIFSYKLGDITVSTLSEDQSERDESILIGATKEQLDKYTSNGKFPMAVNAFLIQSKDKNILVDTGFGRNLFTNLQQLGVAPEKIDAVLLTHLHGDHIGGLLIDGKVAFPNAKVYLAKQEYDYWTDEKQMNSVPEARQAGFKNAQAALKAYGTNVELFQPNELNSSSITPLVPHVKAIAAFGHTPGHTVYLVESNDNKQLLIWGDLIHAMAIQVPVPGITVTFDVDPVEAAKTREAILAYVSKEQIPIAGIHTPYPGIGMITKGTDDGYVFTPAK